ncbi:transcription termination/antitermination protein NusG [Fluviispira multicolorata]|uniref:Transcriptional activator RfaH n=1 Tax=Fluviispira multicolorata TaxID=2654512 RepID=A0A833JAM6_9BACT|nr:transcription termination/antitermination NusG family protein [Fluviispira multicolorata]KAB8028049.1 transcriptional activator RfaH [Fluviispira multicolorata]
MKQWYVAHTQPLKEKYAKSHLLEQDFEVYLPCIKKIRRHARKVDEVLAPLFPRYLFVKFDIEKDRWSKINGTRGISSLITANYVPVQLSEQIIYELKKNENKDGILPISSLELFSKGDKVKIVEGSFKDHNAIFESFTDKDRVQLLLNFLGREMKVLLPVTLIEST